ncbi:hypothetical protein [Pseudomonas sp. TWP3-1]|uniref:hypothetical protein n=1 Tax=Pseudomonas sp. TWP3-1 TaxID=2804631 RepID=UPI003CF89C19
MTIKTDAHVVAALISIGLNDRDSQWAQKACLILVDSERESIVASAVTALGEIARNRGELDRERVLPALDKVKRRFPGLTGTVAAVLGNLAMVA